MKYKAYNGYIEVTEPRKLNKKKALKSLRWLLPFIIFFWLAQITGWEDGQAKSGESQLSFAGLCFILAFVVGIVGWCITYNLGASLFNKKESTNIYFSPLNPDNLSEPLYKEAYDDMIEEIKNDMFDSKSWMTTFYDMNAQLKIRLAAENEAKKKAIASTPRKDYAGLMKETNKYYLKGL